MIDDHTMPVVATCTTGRLRSATLVSTDTVGSATYKKAVAMRVVRMRLNRLAIVGWSIRWALDGVTGLI